MSPTRPVIDRLLPKIDATGDCWTWKGAKTRDGYGLVLGHHGAVRGAHRVVWEELVGPIPPGMTLDHLCRNPLCVNPDHLEPVTIRANILRGHGIAGQRARQTTCLRGHPLPTEGRRRLCRTCRNAANRASDARKRAARV